MWKSLNSNDGLCIHHPIWTINETEGLGKGLGTEAGYVDKIGRVNGDPQRPDAYYAIYSSWPQSILLANVTLHGTTRTLWVYEISSFQR